MAGDIYVSFGADTGELEAAFALAKAETNALAKEMRDLAKEIQATGASMDSDLGRELTAAATKMAAAKAEIASIKKEMKGGGEEEGGGLIAGLKEGLEGALGPITALKASLGEMVELLAVAFAAEGIIEFVKSMGELGEQTERTSKTLGITSEQVGQLNFAAAMTGTSTENLAVMLGHFEAGLAEATTGTGRMAQGLKALGLNARELQGIPLPEQLDKIADATSRFADSTNKTAALASLGRGFVELIPLLDEGSKGMEELRTKADEAGVTLGETLTGRLVDMQHSIVNLGQTIEGLAIGAFKPFIDVVNGAVAILTDIAHSMMESTKEGGALKEILGGVANAFQNLEQFIGETVLIMKDLTVAGDTAANALGVAFQGFGQVVAEVFRSMAASIPGFFLALVSAGAEAVRAVEQQFVDLGTVINETLHLNFSGAKDAFNAMGLDASASAAKITGAFSEVFDFSKASEAASKTNEQLAEIFAKGDEKIVENAKVAQEEYNRIWGIGTAPKGSEAPAAQVPNLQPPGKKDNSVAKEAQAEADAEIQIYKALATQKEKQLDEGLKLHQISMGQWLAQTKDALQDELQDTLAVYDAELQSAKLTSAQKIAIKAKETEAIIQYNTRVQEAEAKAAEATQKSWDSAAKQINSAFESQISGLLKGTTSWSQAVKNVLATLTEDVVKFFVNWGLEAVENAAKQMILGNAVVASHVTGAAAMAAADQASTATSGASWIASALKTLAADASSVFGGVFGFLAPAMGPAAAAPAAAASASVLAGASAIAAADIGMYNVPNDQLAMIHKNELIMPAAQAGALRNVLDNGAAAPGGGGGSVHNHTWNIMGASDPREVARQVAKIFNTQLSLRPAY